MSGKALRSVFLPYGEGNPYPVELARALGEVGAVVERPSCGWFFLPAVFRGGRADILHLHWLEMFFRSKSDLMAFAKLIVFLAQVVMLKIAGVRLAWTVHNIEDHEGAHPVLNRFCVRQIAAMADAIIVHSDWARQEVLKRTNVSRSGNVFVIPHGNYIHSYKNVISRSKARKELGVDESSFVYLFLGAVRKYKGVLDLIDAFTKSVSLGRVLIIAGRPFDELLNREIQMRINGRLNIKYYPDIVPDEMIQVYMNACDVVVFPFRKITTSGSVVLAMSFGKACIAPKLGGIGEVLRDNLSLLYEATDGLGLYRCMNEAFSMGRELEKIGTANRKLAEQCDWGRIGKMTMDVYKWVMT